MPTLEILPASADVLEYFTAQQRHQGDAGINLYCTTDIVVPPQTQTVLEFGVRCRMQSDNGYLSYLLVPRSSISKTPLRMSNSVGVIDSGYRGLIMAYVDNISSQTSYTVKKGSSLFQIIHPSLSPLEVRIVDTLDETSRGEGGFGSTNKLSK